MNHTFIVETRCGHTDAGRGTYVVIPFAIQAENAREAAACARWMPRALHHKKQCVERVVPIDLEGYRSQRAANLDNPYLACRNVQDWRHLGIDIPIFREDTQDDTYSYAEQERRKPLTYHKHNIKNVRSFARMHPEFRSEHYRSECEYIF